MQCHALPSDSARLRRGRTARRPLGRRPSRGWSPGGALAGLVALLGGCAGGEDPLQFLVLEDFAQAGVREVRLDEELTLHFDAELDPSSVHSGSIAVLGAGGRRVEGHFQLDGRQLRFQPRLPRGIELQDGGFRPGERLVLELSGFPALACLRSREGAALQRPFRFEFQAVGPNAPDGLFVYGPQEAPTLLRPESLTIDPEQPVRLFASEAIDPRSVDSSAFQLARPPAAGEGGGGLQFLALRAELVENRPGGATLELRALSGGPESAPRFLEEGVYFLGLVDGAGLPRDLAGRRIEPGWGRAGAGPAGYGSAELRVEQRRSAGGGGARTFDFLDPLARSERALEGGVGAAAWGDTGQVRIALPAAVGDGAAGVVRFEDPETALEGGLSAVRLEVASGAAVELDGAPGPVVIGAQGRLDVAGTLRRRTLRGPLARRAGEGFSAWRGRLLSGVDGELPDLGLDRGQTLTEWLAAAERRGLNVTVLVAGGDLRITGRVDTDGPLLLVAGGRVRITGSVEASELWWSEASLDSVGASELPLAIDEPLLNPLREPQSWRVSSDPFDPPREFSGWGRAWVSGRDGIGRYNVRYAQYAPSLQRSPGSAPLGAQGAAPRLEDPMLLERAAPLVFEIELAAPAGTGEAWDPPSIDRIELTWKRDG